LGGLISWVVFYLDPIKFGEINHQAKPSDLFLNLIFIMTDDGLA